MSRRLVRAARIGSVKLTSIPAASPGTGVIAGGGVRAVLDAAGIKNVLSKSLGSSNHLAVVKATVAGLKQLRSPEHIRVLRAHQPEEAEA